MTLSSNKTEIPLIKETRLQKISASLKCINNFYQNRDAQKICILKEYPGKSEKSAFRGMIIPSLRHLGLIDGTGENISISANGMLLLSAKEKNEKEFLRIARAILLEFDLITFNFINEIMRYQTIEETSFIKKIKSPVNSFSPKQSHERNRQWVKLLIECQLIIKKENQIHLDMDALSCSEKDLNISQKQRNFESIFLKSYKNIKSDDLGIVKISKLRKEISQRYYFQLNEIVTENQFDAMLSNMPHVTESYIISFGEPIGSDEKLFKYNQRYFKTLNIKFFKGD